MSDHYEAVRVRISGRVQGVGFRMWTRDQALQLGVTGWVRNEADGSVTALIAGAGSAISTMLECLKRGPAGASVSSIETETAELEDMLTGFRVTG
ncbi:MULTISPECIES: acylphosphatase [Rhizobium]|uniref:acylphosphatase n=1 Tax=Rhizobium TaxID=379 RepID=UPI001B33A31D|nr:MULTISPECIES: acylphosphatase [Rhizobium]MBX4909596.1 acylphosphatase [Rhizobium bangladeshense]MBX5216778.1 acylphosphatase [Rhizobium sp. NLR9a]MBX5234846.1 acylphosphatase [Rhizobium sp. NLR4a]MBX5247266.1 acylphosphatase [Rhizobium sp. NLR3b]MBX5252332.1 acylphosphatase [Rhizobium sp. NLR4b]